MLPSVVVDSTLGRLTAGVMAAGEKKVQKREPLTAQKKAKNARPTGRPVHHGMMAGDNFPRKNGLLI